MTELRAILNEQRVYALIHKVPILRESEVRLFSDLISMYKPTSVLEIGTAIGYSTLLIAHEMDPSGSITSIELDKDRFAKAQEFIDQSFYENHINLHCADGQQWIEAYEGPPFDMVFLDGPKGQYLNQLNALLPHLQEGAVILADNVLFRGYVEGKETYPKRYKTIVKRLQEYLAFVRQKELFNTTIYQMGDGMAVSIWKGKQLDI